MDDDFDLTSNSSSSSSSSPSSAAEENVSAPSFNPLVHPGLKISLLSNGIPLSSSRYLNNAATSTGAKKKRRASNNWSFRNTVKSGGSGGRVRTIASSKKKDFKQACFKLLEMFKRRDAYSIFQDPVDTTTYSEYLSIIKKPMDLGTMRKKVEAHEYREAIEFQRDFELMCENCKTFNPPGSFHYGWGQKMLDYGKRLLDREIPNMLPPPESPPPPPSSSITRSSHQNVVDSGNSTPVTRSIKSLSKKREQQLMEDEECVLAYSATNLVDPNYERAVLPRWLKNVLPDGSLDPDTADIYYDPTVDTPQLEILGTSQTGSLYNTYSRKAGFFEYGPFAKMVPDAAMGVSPLYALRQQLLGQVFGGEEIVEAYCRSVEEFIQPFPDWLKQQERNRLNEITLGNYGLFFQIWESEKQHSS